MKSDVAVNAEDERVCTEIQRSDQNTERYKCYESYERNEGTIIGQSFESYMSGHARRVSKATGATKLATRAAATEPAAKRAKESS